MQYKIINKMINTYNKIVITNRYLGNINSNMVDIAIITMNIIIVIAT